jgi:1,3-beta-glucanosyltransferase GAS1
MTREQYADFFIGNGSAAAPYIKAAIRDVKSYQDKSNLRKVPIGYSAADIATLRPMLQNYLACGDAGDAIDFFGLNAYEWCGDSSYTLSGYSQLNAMVTDYSVPIFFSETGCQTVRPRTFSDQAAILGPDMDATWSGAIVYEWIEEANDYGLISYGAKVDPASNTVEGGGEYQRSGTPTPISPDFNNLKSQWSAVNPTGVSASAYTTTNSAPACPASTSGIWNVDGDTALPSLGQLLATGSATAASSASATTSAAGSASASATGTKSTANGSKEITGMGIGLVTVMLGFIYWL